MPLALLPTLFKPKPTCHSCALSLLRRFQSVSTLWRCSAASHSSSVSLLTTVTQCHLGGSSLKPHSLLKTSLPAVWVKLWLGCSPVTGCAVPLLSQAQLNWSQNCCWQLSDAYKILSDFQIWRFPYAFIARDMKLSDFCKWKVRTLPP